MQQSFTKAKFWKCALQVNPASYVKYRGQEQSISEADYNKELLKICLEENISVIGLADHGNVDGVDAIRKLMAPHNILVFPGFEISTTEKAHFVCLFPEDTTVQQLERYMGYLQLLDPKDGVRPTVLGAASAIDIVEQNGGFIYAAHCTNDSGVLKKRLDAAWTYPKLRAAQITRTVDDLKSIESGFYYQVIKNRNLVYRRDREMAIINAKDVEKPETLRDPSASCLVKMTRPSFGAFKQAFLDPAARIRLNHETLDVHASAIESMRFEGGYLDGIAVTFSDHLNAVIGGRGTGKSTLLECLRFCLGLRPLTPGAQKQHDEIVEENLGAARGLVELTLRSAVLQGRRFRVTRRFGDVAPTVRDENGAISPHDAGELLPKIEIFGQNEVYELTQDASGLRQVMRRYVEAGSFDSSSQIDQLHRKLKGNRQALNEANERYVDLEAEVNELPKLQDQLAQFQELGLNENLKHVPVLETEKHLSKRVAEELNQVSSAIATLAESAPDTFFLSDQTLEQMPHADLLRQQRTLLNDLKAAVLVATTQLEAQVKAVGTQTDALNAKLLERISEDEAVIEKAFKDIPASQGKTGREIGVHYQNLLREIARIRPKETQLKNRADLIEELNKQRTSLLAELSEARSVRAQPLLRAVKKLNKRLSGKVHVTVDIESDRAPLFDFLASCNLDGVGARRLAWVTEGATFSPASLAAIIRKGSEALQSAGWGVTPSVAEALAKLPNQRVLELEELELSDAIKVELNVAHVGNEPKYRELSRLSTGQQCTALLHLLLIENHDPLILDQPEDNLDNAFIAERIVSEVRGAKLSRQFIFATHNANIPVFGDAEWIGVLSSLDGQGLMPEEQQGAIDQPNVQQLAADILEGGRSAFNQRREKYGFE